MVKSDWNTYQALVLDELRKHGERLDKIDDKVDKVRTIDIPALKVDIAFLKVKAGIWGAVAGMIPVMLAFAVQYFKH